MKKKIYFNDITTAAKVAKFASMGAASVSFALKKTKLPVISTGICFVSAIVETISDKLSERQIMNELFDGCDVEDDDEDDAEEILEKVAEELASNSKETEETTEK